MVRDTSCFSPCVFFTQICLWTFPVSSDKREIRTKSQCQHALYVVSFLQSKMIFYRPSFKVCDTKILQSFSIFCVYLFLFFFKTAYIASPTWKNSMTQSCITAISVKRDRNQPRSFGSRSCQRFFYIYIYFNIHFTVSTIKL